MTPYQLGLYVQVYNECKEEEVKLKEAEMEINQKLAYLTAAWTSSWVWAKRIPGYDDVMKGNKAKKKMTPEEMLEEVKKLNVALGGITY